MSFGLFFPDKNATIMILIAIHFLDWFLWRKSNDKNFVDNNRRQANVKLYTCMLVT